MVVVLVYGMNCLSISLSVRKIIFCPSKARTAGDGTMYLCMALCSRQEKSWRTRFAKGPVSGQGEAKHEYVGITAGFEVYGTCYLQLS